eukprot:TRINITY_DN5783_c0_g1_i1.p1 TRINITY_DN5783_c0_g1~~TRINITY_DN5783_c0_g1_i1.p1  ORF type:complete len:475 (-),score=83.34 TRINITY_DN5783_c0_g1_i1:32-1456(-)
MIRGTRRSYLAVSSCCFSCGHALPSRGQHAALACVSKRPTLYSTLQEQRYMSSGSPAQRPATGGIAKATVVPAVEVVQKASPVKKPWHELSPNALAVVNAFRNSDHTATANLNSHLRNLLSLASAASHDHMMLRMFAMSSSFLGVVHNTSMPKPLKTHQKVAACWGMTFFLLHFVNLLWLLRERGHGIHFTDEEEDIYENGFQRHGVTRRQFKALLNAGARFKDYGPGETMTEKGEPVNKVIYIAQGTCMAEHVEGVTLFEVHQDVFIGELQPNLWRAECMGCGDMYTSAKEEDGDAEDAWLIEHVEAMAKRSSGRGRDVRKMLSDGLTEKVGTSTKLAAGTAWMNSYNAGDQGCRVLMWPLATFTCTVGNDAKLCEACEHMDKMGLASKISAGSSKKALDGYNELLALVIADGRIDPEEKHALHRYRARHAIPEHQHILMLQELGWDKSEFEDGIKESKWLSVMDLWRQKNKR